MKVKEITTYLESIAPLEYQEHYDNCGLLCGSYDLEIKGILVTLDVTQSVLSEAEEKGCNLVIAHHPLLFKKIKQLIGKNHIEQTLIQAIKKDIAIYAAHTNLDNISTGVNAKICEKLDLLNTRVLLQKNTTLYKLTTFVPSGYKEKLLQALTEEGAGKIGNYSYCSFQTEGKGTFIPNERATPRVGEINRLETVNEIRIEMILHAHLADKIISTMKQVHPYEEVAYYLHPLRNLDQEVGAGMIGCLPKPMEILEFLAHLRKRMQLTCIRHTSLLSKTIRKVAVCGGTGGSLLKNSIKEGADIFITADCKYHEFFETENQIIIADIGHYESEFFTKELFYELIERYNQDLKLVISQINTNPVQYFF